MFQTGPTIFTFNGLFGVRVEVAQSLVMLVLLFVFLSGLSNIFWVATTVGMILLSIYLHELGHAWACQVQGVPVRRIVIHGGGGFCERSRSASFRQQEFIIMMGPLVNLALWALSSLGVYYIFNGTNAALYELGNYLWWFSRINLALFAFNLLPVQPLDGGKLLQLWLIRVVPKGTAMKLTGAIGLVFSVLWWPTLFWLWYTYGWLLLFAPSIKTHYGMMKGEVRF